MLVGLVKQARDWLGLGLGLGLRLGLGLGIGIGLRLGLEKQGRALSGGSVGPCESYV